MNERAAWCAASEAATQGAPAELTYATDLRVIECSRDPRVRDEIEAAHVTVGDTTWATALHAISDEAWERAWRAADTGSKELSTVGLRDQIRRVTAAVAKRSAGDDDVEAALESAEQAARDELTRAALRGGAPVDGEHPWDAARNAARSSPGGTIWAMVMDDARRARRRGRVGPGDGRRPRRGGRRAARRTRPRRPLRGGRGRSRSGKRGRPQRGVPRGRRGAGQRGRATTRRSTPPSPRSRGPPTT